MRERLRCAIYTRKSSEEGLDQDFSSLDAQREASAAYIRSQAHEGWRLVDERFDDGGFSGGTTERPALQRLLEKVRQRRIDVIVIYKIDRLTRSLADFARLAELFDACGVSFVSVTQQFNTTTSMGRLMLNVLLSFAQFEREITGERIRDKIAASKKKGLWMGGTLPLGYDAVDRKLVINQAEAETVRKIFRLYLEHGRVRAVVEEAERLGLRSKSRIGPRGQSIGGFRLLAGNIYQILKNPLYIGRIRHRELSYPGMHEPILDLETWDAAQQQLLGNRNGHRSRPNAREPSPLAGMIVDADGNRFTPSHTTKVGRRYRYYVDQALITGEKPNGRRLRRLPALEIEGIVRQELTQLLSEPGRLLAALGDSLDAAETDQALREAGNLHQALAEATPAAWADRVRPILRQVAIGEDFVRLRILRDGLRAALSLPAMANELLVEDGDRADRGLHDILVQARVRTRGGQIKLIVGPQGDHARRDKDAALIKAVARAHLWFDRLKSGEATSARAIAREEQVTGSYVSRFLKLAFLAPDIVEAILDGRHPVDLTAERLLVHQDLPLSWDEQRRQLGFNPG
ncbi:recombinase family protein [Oceanibacterium hippocampi]|uniref:DNA-invertase hin n=1 Tax=Oceanibacterium hippocampi TaxID=745714 RepID=A0A1Y5TZ75_9PROT|nr:recombinase family protein [Oceanibacterium hippocampi]SLN77039.1 DNA-invertase hin [Oceanibacterium hippocampi]